MLKLDQKGLNKLVENVLEFPKKREYEKCVVELVEAKKAIDEAYSTLTSKLKEVMVKEGLDSVEGDVARVSVSEAGYKYVADDVKEVDPKFLDLKLKMSAIGAFEKKEGKLPDNIKHNPNRSYSCRITLKGGVHEHI